MFQIILLTLALYLLEKELKPRLDYTKEKELLLWYNHKNKRNYIKIL